MNREEEWTDAERDAYLAQLERADAEILARIAELDRELGRSAPPRSSGFRTLLNRIRGTQ